MEDFIQSVDTPLAAALAKIISGVLMLVVVVRGVWGGWDRVTGNKATPEQLQLYTFLKGLTGTSAAWSKNGTSVIVKRALPVGSNLAATAEVSIDYAQDTTKRTRIALNNNYASDMMTPRQCRRIIERAKRIGQALDRESATTKISVLLTGTKTA